VTRTGFYSKRNHDGTERPGPYQHLAEEFERRLKVLQEAGKTVEPRDAQIDRLKAENEALRERLAARNGRIEELTEFQTLTLSRPAAQHAEVERSQKRLADSGTTSASCRLALARPCVPRAGPCPARTPAPRHRLAVPSRSEHPDDRVDRTGGDPWPLRCVGWVGRQPTQRPVGLRVAGSPRRTSRIFLNRPTAGQTRTAGGILHASLGDTIRRLRALP